MVEKPTPFHLPIYAVPSRQLIIAKSIQRNIDGLIVFCQYLKMSAIGVFLRTAFTLRSIIRLQTQNFCWPAGENQPQIDLKPRG